MVRSGFHQSCLNLNREVAPASNVVRGTPVQVDTPEVELNVYGYSQELQQRLLSSSALLAEVLERTKLQLPSRSLQIEPPPVLSARGQLARVPQSTAAANMATAATKFERLTGYSPSPTRPLDIVDDESEWRDEESDICDFWLEATADRLSMPSSSELCS